MVFRMAGQQGNVCEIVVHADYLFGDEKAGINSWVIEVVCDVSMASASRRNFVALVDWLLVLRALEFLF
jgi:hypothetical protein